LGFLSDPLGFTSVSNGFFSFFGWSFGFYMPDVGFLKMRDPKRSFDQMILGHNVVSAQCVASKFVKF